MSAKTQLSDDMKSMEKVVESLRAQVNDALLKQHEAMTRAVKLAERNQKLEKELQVVDKLALSVEAECNSALKENTGKVSRIQDELDASICKIQQMRNQMTELMKINDSLKRNAEDTDKRSRERQRCLMESLKDRESKLAVLRQQEEELREEVQKMTAILKNQKQRIMELEMDKRHQANNVDHRKKTTGRQQSNERTIRVRSNSPASHLSLQLTEILSDTKSSSEENMQQESYEDLAKEISMLECSIKHGKSASARMHTRPPPQIFTMSTQTVMDRLRKERDNAKCDVERLQNEIGALRGRLETATAEQIEEKSHYQRCLAEEEERVRNLQLECQDLLKSQSFLNIKVDKQEENISSLMKCLDEVKDNLRREQNINKHLKRKIDQKTEELDTVGRQCTEMEKEMEQLEKCNMELREKLNEATSQLGPAKEDMDKLTCLRRKLERETKLLKKRIFDQEDKCCQMKIDLYDKERQNCELMQRVLSLKSEKAVLKCEYQRIKAILKGTRASCNPSNEKIMGLKRELREKNVEIQGYKDQISGLHKKIASLEMNQSIHAEEKEKLEAHLSTAHQLFTELHNKTHNFSTNKCLNEATLEKMHCSISFLRRELDKFKNLSMRQRKCIDSLENVLGSRRRESMQYKLSNQELQDKVLRLQNVILDLQKSQAPREDKDPHKKGPQTRISVERTEMISSKSPQQRNPRLVLQAGQKTIDLPRPHNAKIKVWTKSQHGPKSFTRRNTPQTRSKTPGRKSPRLRSKENLEKMDCHTFRADDSCTNAHYVSSRTGIDDDDDDSREYRSRRYGNLERSSTRPGRGRSPSYERRRWGPRERSHSPSSQIHVRANFPKGSELSVELEENESD